MDTPALSARLDALAEHNPRWEALSSAVRSELPDEAAIRLALNAYPADSEKVGGPYWLDPSDVPDEYRMTWLEVANTCTSPLVRARLYDLLWILRHQPAPHEHAWHAIDAYIELGLTGNPKSSPAVEALLRALHLARSLHHEKREAAAVDACLRVAGACAPPSMSCPGLVVALLEPLAASEEYHNQIRDIITVALADPDVGLGCSGLVELARTVSKTEEERASLAEELVRRWIEPNIKNPASSRFGALQHARDLALKFGLPDLVDRIGVEIEKLDARELGFTHGLEITGTLNNKAIAQKLFSLRSWRDGLEELAVWNPLTDGVPEIEAFCAATSFIPHDGLLGLATISTIGHLNQTQTTASDEEAKTRLAESHRRKTQLSSYGPVLARAFGLLMEEHGPPDEKLIRDFLVVSYDVTEGLAERMAHGAHLCLQGDSDAGAHTLVPRLEAVLRNYALRKGISASSPPRGKTPGGVRLLGGLLDKLEGHMDENKRAHLTSLLTDVEGLNLRNEIAHGLSEDVGPYEAVLILHACLAVSRLGE